MRENWSQWISTEQARQLQYKNNFKSCRLNNSLFQPSVSSRQNHWPVSSVNPGKMLEYCWLCSTISSRGRCRRRTLPALRHDRRHLLDVPGAGGGLQEEGGGGAAPGQEEEKLFDPVRHFTPSEFWRWQSFDYWFSTDIMYGTLESYKSFYSNVIVNNNLDLYTILHIFFYHWNANDVKLRILPNISGYKTNKTYNSKKF